jgi:hypothetical protein
MDQWLDLCLDLIDNPPKQTEAQLQLRHLKYLEHRLQVPPNLTHQQLAALLLLLTLKLTLHFYDYPNGGTYTFHKC